MSGDWIVSEAYRAFSGFARPEHFTDHTHCEECAEHDETMRSRSLGEIGIHQVGNPGWSPIPLLTERAYGYVLPRLVELALNSKPYPDSFVFSYLLALTPSPEHRKFDYFTPDQRSIVLQSLYYIKDCMGAQIEWECCQSNLSEAIALWQAIAPNGSSKAAV